MPNSLTIRALDSIGDIAAEQWDSCAGSDNPFVSHAFLLALEQSKSATEKTGWGSRHLVIDDGKGNAQACAPLYVKSHSYGEYVFDWGWAEAWQRAGADYYPKLQCAVPFTPVTGPRFLIRPGADRALMTHALAQAMTATVDNNDLSSAHVTFPTEEEARALEAEGWLLRIGEQYHFTNPGYASFDDFLAQLASRKRKAIKKERAQAHSHGLTIRALVGDQITPKHWTAFHQFYLDTIGRKWGQAYLTRDFFTRIGKLMGDRAVLMVAEDNGRPVAGALNMRGTDALYGRNWGAEAEYKFLHFELCYYQAIEFAIEHKLARVEAGAQGEHKVSRGYVPSPTWSVHYIREERFRRAVEQFLEQERMAILQRMQAHAEGSPFRHEEAEGQDQP